MNEEADVQTPFPSGRRPTRSTPLNPNESRFLFVEVAAQRAKQLRRGALNRLAPTPETGVPEAPLPAHKPERVAMEEVRRGYMQYGTGEAPAGQAKAEELS